MSSSHVKLVIFVPKTHTETVRQALGNAGTGSIGNYRRCCFSTQGIEEFLPVEGADPFIGTMGVIEKVEGERIEVNVPRDILSDVITAMKKVHPYEEVAYDIYPLEDNSN